MKKALLSVAAFFAIAGMGYVLSAASPSDMGINVNFGPTVLTQPYNGQNGNAVVGAKQVATSSIGNQFSSGVRSDISAISGGIYGGDAGTTQTAYFGYNSEGIMTTQGQLGGYWGYQQGLGVGNSFYGNGVSYCYGGGEVNFPSSTPECEAVGEFDALQGSYVWQATLTGSPTTGTTNFTFNTGSVVNGSYLGARAILNSNHTIKGGGTISSFTGCYQGASSPCPGTCPGGIDSLCTVVQFSGADLTASSPAQWYFKTGYTNDLYAAPCHGDDVSLPNANGTGSALCVGHWYLAEITGAEQITLYGTFDGRNLGQYLGTGSYEFIQGQPATAASQSAGTFTLPANTNTWASGDSVYSPPNQYMAFGGMNIFLNKYYLSDNGPTNGIEDINYGPEPMQNGLDIGGAGSNVGGFYYGVNIHDLNIRDAGPSGVITQDTEAIHVGTPVNYVLTAGNGSTAGPINVIALGANAASQTLYEPDSGTLLFSGSDIQVGVGVYNNGNGFKHARVSTGNISANSVANIGVVWGSAFADTNYTLVCSVYDTNNALVFQQTDYQGQSEAAVNVKNTSITTTYSGLVDCIAVHD